MWYGEKKKKKDCFLFLSCIRSSTDLLLWLLRDTVESAIQHCIPTLDKAGGLGK